LSSDKTFDFARPDDYHSLVAVRYPENSGERVTNLIKELHFKDGLIPAVIVDSDGGEVLTLCYMNEEALRETFRTGLVHVFRRSHGRLMKKGETSGHVQRWQEIRVDCEGNSLLLVVEQRIAACHSGYRGCYYRRYLPAQDAWEIVGEKVFAPGEGHGKPA
jgi:phosphoribosyl-AMP cyclohydrolase